MNSFLKAFIAVSVLLNLLLAGVIIGDIGHHFMGNGRHLTMHEVAAAFPVDKRAHLEETLSRADLDISALRQQLNDDRKGAAAILKAEPFNQAAYVAKVQEIQRLKMQILQRVTDTVIGLAGQATPKERAAMADYCSRGIENRFFLLCF